MKVVLAIGCFDGLHVGHVAHLEAARKLGSRLIVALTGDAFVGKGPGRPVFKWEERARMLRALRCVSSVIQSEHPCIALQQVAPHIYVKGIEYADQDIPEHETCLLMGIKMVYLNTEPVYHSSHILSGELLRERIKAA